ncbi:MAG: Ig-like domain-containing protein, partial [Lachnospira sp.]
MAKQMDYTVSIYTGLTDVDNPESGELKAQKSGSFSSGDKDNLLKTVAFDEPVTVNQGEIFSVVAAFAGSGGQSVMLYYDCARTLNGIQANCAAQPHQSYIYLNEYYGWSDYGNTNNTNFRIKAFTNNVAEPDTAVTAVKLNKHALELNWQQSEQLTAEVLPENAANKNVIWTSSDSGVAEVSQEGVVTAKGAGSAVITVETEDGKMQDSCTVTVKKPITDIKITGTGELKAGDKAALSVVILPQDTTDDTTVVWTSSDTNIAAVDQNGLVTALSKGTVTITAKAGTHTAEHTLVITQAAPKPTESTTEATTEVTKPTQKPTESTTEATTEAPKPTQKPTESTTEATTEAPKPTPKPTESTTEATTEAPKPTQKPTEATTEATKPTESTTEVTKPSEQPTETPTQKPDTEPTKPDTEEKVVYEMRQDAEGVWHYYANDVIAADYCGMACNEYGWWYIQNGDVNFTYTGMACNEYGWWYFNNGQLDLTFYGLANNEYGTWFYTNGQLNFGFTGMLIPDDRWLYVRNGQVLTDYTGMAVNEYGWWYFKDGQLDFSYTGMACNEYGWWYFNNGQLNLTFNGLADNEYGTWFYTNGQLNFGFT